MFSEKRLKNGIRETYAEGRSFTCDECCNPIYVNESTDRNSNDFSPSVMRKNPSLLIPTRFSIDNKEDVDINDVLAPFEREADKIINQRVEEEPNKNVETNTSTNS